MAGRLEGKVALITQIGGCDGRAAAVRFAAEGAAVVGCDLNPEEARRTVATVEAARGRIASLHPVDLTDGSEVRALIELSVDTFGGFDILYNNASVAHQPNVENVARADRDAEVSLVCRMVCYALPVFKRRGRGVIINVSGVGPAGSRTVRANLASPDEKAAVIRLTENLAIGLLPLNVRVNCISPGPIDTREFGQVVGDSPDSPMRELIAGKCLVPPVGEPDEIATAAIFLASDEASRVTGVNIPVDGVGASGGVDPRFSGFEEEDVRLHGALGWAQ